MNLLILTTKYSQVSEIIGPAVSAYYFSEVIPFLHFCKFTELKMLGNLTNDLLIHLNLTLHLYTPENVRKAKLQWGIEMEHHAKMVSTV